MVEVLREHRMTSEKVREEQKAVHDADRLGLRRQVNASGSRVSMS